MSREKQYERAALARRRTLELHHRRTWEPSPPRFVVGSVTGYPIGPKAASGGGRWYASTEWYVYDSDYCFAIVRAFAEGRLLGHLVRPAERRAAAYADELNRQDEAREWEEAAQRPPGALSSRRGGDLDLSLEARRSETPTRRHSQHPTEGTQR